MKKKFLPLLLAVSVSLNVHAHGEQLWGISLFKNASWTPFQFSFWPLHLVSPKADVYGISLSPGLVGPGNRVCGLSFGLISAPNTNNALAASICSIGMKNNGLALGAVNSWEENNGVSIGLVNTVRIGRGGNTLQIGLFNSAENGLQLGLLNHDPTALIAWMPLVNFSRRGRSAEDSLKELRERPYPFDDHISRHGKRFFPHWNRKTQLRWLTELFPLTDAGATFALMEVAKNNGLLDAWDQHALSLPPAQRKKLRYALGFWITQEYWRHKLEVTPEGVCTLRLTDTRNGAECVFRAKCDKLPPESLTVEPFNSDLSVGRRTERHLLKNNVLNHESRFDILFEVRRDAETDLWFETGSSKAVRAKKAAVTTFEEVRSAPVCTGIVNGKKVYETFRLPEKIRKIKLGELKPQDILRSPAEGK